MKISRVTDKLIIALMFYLYAPYGNPIPEWIWYAVSIANGLLFVLFLFQFIQEHCDEW
jgi:hypothetical protein